MAAMRLKTRPGCETCGTLGPRLGRAVARMNAVIGAVVDFARGGLFGTGLTVSPAPTDVGELCRTLVQDLSTLHPDRPILLEVGPSVHGRCDRGRIEQVLSNLVGNAIKHGEGAVLVGAREQEGRLALSVRNGGPAIPADRLASLFEPFQKRPDSDGLGLGLFIVREIVRAHGGTVEVRSTPEEGTTFTCGWPQ
jgi:signal transduction histidine kinase